MTEARSGGQILIDGLRAHGVDTVFCVPGESYLNALDALYNRKTDIQLISCRQEGGAAYMAEAYGKLTGTPGVCFVSRGPGASNAMIGVHTAFQDSTPLLLFIGQIARDDNGREAFQSLDYQQVYAGVAKKVIRIDSAGRIPEQLQQAWNIAITGRPGPVVVELPEDMLVDRFAVSDCSPKPVFRAGPDPDGIKQIRALLEQAERPIVISGGAGWTQAATDYLTEFSESWSVPVVTAFRRSDSFNNHHSHYIGELGLAANPELVQAVRSSDLLIAIGPTLGDITTNGYQLFAVPNGVSHSDRQRLVHVHVAAEKLNSVYQADLGIVSHPELFLREIRQRPAKPQDRNAFIAPLRQSYLDFLMQPRFSGAALRMDKVAEHLRARLEGDTIITNGAGNYTTWAQRHYQFTHFGTQLAPTNGSMGYGVPASIAAKIAQPDRTVVSFSGDGCFLMNGQELATAVQYNLNIVFLVINNNTYGTIKMHQQRHYPDRPIGTSLQNPDFAALGRAYGTFATTVKQTEQFPDAFEQALNSNRPALIELQTDYF